MIFTTVAGWVHWEELCKKVGIQQDAYQRVLLTSALVWGMAGVGLGLERDQAVVQAPITASVDPMESWN